ncbi:imm11 family protein [Saccharibacillus alkalitolerans]|uniref:Immunity MXAN-0049 protein domain-containing protein n=1 Tax=Saccharibacillus alkalitolerans TaxID=2705290 RepID=A0ABX0F6T0_9BACL|nr:DUF1629 domain-containing protein [Saccharibacillus alkalitolerans]NGZ76673.1 hypothetical protein [Saccharibacillus alkalitolerans]
MDYYFLESQYPRSGFIGGETIFAPELNTNYSAIDDPLPEGTTAEVVLLSSVRSLKADYFETTTGTKIISDGFKTLLEQRRTGVQFIPAAVRCHDGRPAAKTYWVAHRPDRLDVFDYERSEYGRKAVIAASVHEPPRKIVKVVSRICLREEEIGGREFFLPAYVNLWKPIISADFYEACRKHKLNLHVTAVGQINV